MRLLQDRNSKFVRLKVTLQNIGSILIDQEVDPDIMPELRAGSDRAWVISKLVLAQDRKGHRKHYSAGSNASSTIRHNTFENSNQQQGILVALQFTSRQLADEFDKAHTKSRVIMDKLRLTSFTNSGSRIETPHEVGNPKPTNINPLTSASPDAAKHQLKDELQRLKWQNEAFKTQVTTLKTLLQEKDKEIHRLRSSLENSNRRM